MTTNYPIGDFLIRLKNAARASLKEVEVPSTKLIVSVCEVLVKEGYVNSFKKEKDGTLRVVLSFRKKEPVLLDLKLVSKPGLRVYKNSDEIKKKMGASIFIISTSKGMVSSKEAIVKKIGGEVIAEIW